MKVIIAGATGVAGREAVNFSLSEDRVTKVVLLTRKSLPGDITSNPKVEVVMHDDFSNYPASVLDKLKGAEACVWAIGGRVDQFNGDKEMCRKVNVTFTLAAAKAMQEAIAEHSPTGKLRFVFCSGLYTEWDQEKKLYFLNDSRKIKGEVEKGLSGIADAHPDRFEAFFLRPGGFMEPDAGIVKRALGTLYVTTPTPQLGKALVKVAMNGWKDRTIENPEILGM